MSAKIGPERHDQSIDPIHHVMERFDQRLTLYNPVLTDSYIKAEL